MGYIDPTGKIVPIILGLAAYAARNGVKEAGFNLALQTLGNVKNGRSITCINFNQVARSALSAASSVFRVLRKAILS